MWELILLIVVAALLIGIVSFLGFLFFKYHNLLELPKLLGMIKDIQEFEIKEYSREGGIASVASRQSRTMLSEIMKTIFDKQIPFGDAIRENIPQIDEWIQEKPFGIAALVMNPMFQKAAQTFMQQFGNGNVQKLPNQPQQATYY